MSVAASELGIDCQVVERAALRFVREELTRTGRSSVVLGVSGGVDSAVVLDLAVRALGAERVVAITLPYRSSNPRSEADARLVAEHCGVELQRVEITPLVDGFSAAVGEVSAHRLGNAMARARMLVLYDRSERDAALVLGTSNKSELLLGYGTLNGDLSSALNPLGDLYKTQVWALARHLGLPATVIDKAPSADLVAGQSDESDLGFAYRDVDPLLAAWIDGRCSRRALLAMGFAADLIERVQLLVRRSQFKRQSPLVLKLGGRTVGTDFHHARDWGT